MGLVRNRLHRRFPKLALVSDLALVGAAANRMVQRRRGSATASAASGAELALAGGAAIRLLQRLRRRRKARRLARAATDTIS